MARGYVIEDREGESKLARQVREETVRRLADEWSALDRQADRESLLREVDEDAYDDARETARENAEDEAEAERAHALAAGKTSVEAQAIYDEALADALDAWERREEEHVSRHDRRMEAIEAVLADLGARMMRPYEHHGEMERQIEWMENRYDYGEE